VLRQINMKVVASMVFLCVVAAAIVLLLNPIAAFTQRSDANNVKNVTDVLNRALSQFYALEGSYPPSLDILEKKYGVILNRDKYYYYYEAFSSNIRPTVEVILIPKEAQR